MQVSEPIVEAWKAELALGFERRDTGTVLARRAHHGPLRVQKALHPEGPEVCHVVVLHPPSGIAGGDELDIGVTVGAGAHALLTTPGAGKWYRSTGAWASQALNFNLHAGAVLEWLPQETIVYDAALADMRTQVHLATGARYIGQEVLCLGRRAMGERFAQGSMGLATDIHIGDKLIWHERGLLAGGSRLMEAPTGLAGCSVSATLLAAGMEIPSDLLAACREPQARETDAQYGLTALPQLLVARYLGHSSESARAWLADIWAILRPVMADRPAHLPRIWNT